MIFKKKNVLPLPRFEPQITQFIPQSLYRQRYPLFLSMWLHGVTQTWV